MIHTLHRLDGSIERAVTLDDATVRYLAGMNRPEGCAWCGAYSSGGRITHRELRGQACPLGVAVMQLDLPAPLVTKEADQPQVKGLAERLFFWAFRVVVVAAGLLGAVKLMRLALGVDP